MDLPRAPEPVGDYQAVIIRQGFGFVSGQFPLRNGTLIYSGTIGSKVSEDEACEAMKLTSYNVLSHISQATNNFKSLNGILRLEGHLSCSAEFENYIGVLDEASQVFNEHLGDKGKHSRSLFIHSRLPLDSPIELCVSFCVNDIK